MEVKINRNLSVGGAWYRRGYLEGKTCRVLAVSGSEYFVLHPITKIPGYWIHISDCEVIPERIQSWDEFLKDNSYGYKKYPDNK